jgi:large subunit ribosomal protein L30
VNLGTDPVRLWATLWLQFNFYEEARRQSLAMAKAKMLAITAVRSSIGTKPKQRATLKALGLRRIGRTVIKEDRPEIRGMIRKVAHLVKVEEVEVDKSRKS